MQRKWLVCALMTATALAQANSGAEPQPQKPAAAPAQTDTKPTDPVVTITGFCAHKPAAPKAAAGAVAKAPAATTTSGECKTVITREQFEKLANALAPALTPQFKRQLANILPRLMVLSAKAEASGLDKTSQFSETMKFARMQILTNEMQKHMQDDAAKISDAQIKEYYDAHQPAFQQFSLDRIFVPRAPQEGEEAENGGDADKDAKLTEEQQKAKQEQADARKKTDEESMTKLAETLRDRAAKGEDFAKLQDEAYKAAGMKIENVTVNIPHVRRTGLPPGHTSVLDKKPGEVTMIADSGGHYIYRINTVEEIPLATAKDEIHNTLQNQNMKDATDKMNTSFKTQLNDAYFSVGPAHPGMPMQAPHPVAPSGAPQP